MSHRAMNWALEQRQLKPAPWRVLVMLADRHNKDTLRVDPEQALLAHDCNMSRSTVNRHLEDLEDAGLLVRVPRVNPKTQKQMPTFYVLAPDFVAPPDIEFAVSDYRTRIAEVQSENGGGARVPNPDTGAVSQKSQIPCPKKRDSRVSKSDTNPVKEPGIEPGAVSAQTFDSSKDGISDDRAFRQFFAAYPRSAQEPAAKDAFDVALGDATGQAREELKRWIISAAKRYAIEQKGNETRYILMAKTWLKQREWQNHPKPARACGRPLTVEEREALEVRNIQSGIPALCSHIPRELALELARKKLVTGQQLRDVNLATVADLDRKGIAL